MKRRSFLQLGIIGSIAAAMPSFAWARFAAQEEIDNGHFVLMAVHQDNAHMMFDRASRVDVQDVMMQHSVHDGEYIWFKIAAYRARKEARRAFIGSHRQLHAADYAVFYDRGVAKSHLKMRYNVWNPPEQIMLEKFKHINYSSMTGEIFVL